MKQIAQVPLTIDLFIFSQWLGLQGLVHRIIEKHDQQLILMEDNRFEAEIRQTLNRYLQEPDFRARLDQEVRQALQRHAEQEKTVISPNVELYARATPKQAPVIFLLMFVSIIFAWLSDFLQCVHFLRELLILDPFKLNMDLSSMAARWDGLISLLAMGEVWRVVSPDFIHFNMMHITFNLLMLWVLGGQLEIQKGSISFIALVVFVSVISNIGQLLESSYLFGGMSGVVYGLVGYCWLWKHFQPKIFFPDALLKFTLGWLILGYTPVTEWLGWGRMANAAHLYGLIAGILWGAVTLFVNERVLAAKKT